MGDLETTLADWSIGSLLGLWFQSVFVGLCSHILTIAIFLVIYGRMIEVYLTVSVGPIPFAVGDDIAVAIWECMGYTVLLCYTLFKTGSLAKSLFRAH